VSGPEPRWCDHGPDDRCEYGRSCGEPRTHAVIWHAVRHPLCTEHAKPEYHPPDLRSQLMETP
jgi:hypothetical protein